MDVSRIDAVDGEIADRMRERAMRELARKPHQMVFEDFQPGHAPA